jgi:hypothetical protein
MKKIIILHFLLLSLFSCKKENEYFTSDEIYNTVIESADKIHEGISKTDRIFYVFNRHDTLIVMSSERENTLRPTYSIQKIGYFTYKNNKIIIAKPYKAKFEFINKNNKLNYIDNDLKPPYYHGNDYQKGFVYKMKDLQNLELIDQGNVMKYFKPNAEYEYLPPPSPTN